MDFVANGSKNVEIETSTGVYLRHAIPLAKESYKKVEALIVESSK